MKTVEAMKSFLNKDILGGMYKRWHVVAMDVFAISLVLLLTLVFGVAMWVSIACMSGYVLKRAFMEYLIKHFDSDPELQQVFSEVRQAMKQMNECGDNEVINITPAPEPMGFSVKGLANFDSRLANSLKWRDLALMVALGVVYGMVGLNAVFAVLLGLFVVYKHWDVALYKTNQEGVWHVYPDSATLWLSLLAFSIILWPASLGIYTICWGIFMISFVAQQILANKSVVIPAGC